MNDLLGHMRPKRKRTPRYWHAHMPDGSVIEVTKEGSREYSAEESPGVTACAPTLRELKTDLGAEKITPVY